MKDRIMTRALSAAEYTLDNHSTVRETAKVFKVSKSTVHEDLTERLPKINPQPGVKGARRADDQQSRAPHQRWGSYKTII